MATVTFKGSPYRLVGELPAVGSAAPPFRLTAADLSDVGLEHFGSHVKLLNIVPSLDTPVCATSARHFHEALGRLPGVLLLNISADLPFAQKRFCDAGRLDRIITLSTFRSPVFGTAYGVQIEEGPLAGLMARAVLVLSRENRVVHAELVPEITREPDYDAALRAAEKAAAG
ncbi:MAG: thiol peroxidase [Kiritimatiellae bacterium]|nr:thiol peroxidase [Kiritimatiellia bacterium]